jgi:pseudouridine synthase
VTADGERLQKVLARAGLASRRACEELIADGRVTVNGEVADLGRRVDPTSDVIEVDGALVPIAPGLVHYLLNKPAGVVTTAADTHGRPTVVELVPDDPRVFPVGRLDADTEGLLLLTNDGELTHRLTHPSFGVEKEYLASVEGDPSPAALRRLREGVELDDGVIRTLEQRGFIEEVARDPGPGQAILYGTTRQFLERLGLDSVDQLPALGEFVPGPDIVEALEQGLRADPDE